MNVSSQESEAIGRVSIYYLILKRAVALDYSFPNLRLIFSEHCASNVMFVAKIRLR